MLEAFTYKHIHRFPSHEGSRHDPVESKNCKYWHSSYRASLPKIPQDSSRETTAPSAAIFLRSMVMARRRRIQACRCVHPLYVTHGEVLQFSLCWRGSLLTNSTHVWLSTISIDHRRSGLLHDVDGPYPSFQPPSRSDPIHPIQSLPAITPPVGTTPPCYSQSRPSGSVPRSPMLHFG